MNRFARRDNTGFTLVELLVVVLVIGLLAGIAIPVFLGTRSKGYTATIQSAVRNAATAEESYAVDHDGSYLTSGTAESNLLSEGFRVTPGVTVTIAPSALGAGYCLVGRNPATAAELWFTNDGGAGGRVTDVKPANC